MFLNGLNQRLTVGISVPEKHLIACFHSHLQKPGFLTYQRFRCLDARACRLRAQGRIKTANTDPLYILT